jgi:chromosome partitioning protein
MIYGLTNSKGGVGKTSIAVHLAAWLIGKRRVVAFIDADSQQSASSWIKDPAIDVRLEQIDDGDELVHRIPEIAADVDEVVIDGPAGLTATTRAIMLRADRVFLPCGPSILDLPAAGKAVQLLRDAQGSRKGLLTGALIPNKLQKPGRLSREMLALLRKHQVPLLAGLSHRQAFADAAGQGRIVMDMGAPALLVALE